MGKAIKRICTICARGGSKSVPGKNLRLLAGKPLLVYTIKQAMRSNLFDAIAVSSDSDEILKVAKKAGVLWLVKRPLSMADDMSPKVPAMQHCVKEVEAQSGVTYNTIVDLDVTAPLRSISDIKGAVELLETKQVPNVITGAPSRRSPYFNMVKLDTAGTASLVIPPKNLYVRRQDVPDCYDMNASIYVWSRQGFFQSQALFQKGTLFYLMPSERSIDIDTELDFKIVDYLMKKEVDERA
jgi:CMP-N,N'-diacetyllegionaminic acid synthase